MPLEFTNFIVPSKKNLILGILAGIIVAFAFILINIMVPAVTIGIPSWFATTGEKFVTVTLGAPVGEELVFSILLLWIIFWLVGFFTKKEWIKWIVSAIILIPLFSIFHANAYAGSLSAQSISATAGLFIGAMLFRAIQLAQLYYFKNPYGVILTHMIVNTYLITQMVVVSA